MVWLRRALQLRCIRTCPDVKLVLKFNAATVRITGMARARTRECWLHAWSSLTVAVVAVARRVQPQGRGQ